MLFQTEVAKILFQRRTEKQTVFRNGEPSKTWLETFLTGNPELKLKPVSTLKAMRVATVTSEHVREHVAREEEAMKKYNIHETAQILNCDEAGIALTSGSRRALRDGFGTFKKRIFQIEALVKGMLGHIALLGVVSVSGVVYKPAIIFPGKHARYRILNGNVETMHNYLFRCHSFQRDPAGINLEIFCD